MRTAIWLAAALAIVATLAPAFYHGTRNFRWGHDERTTEVASGLREFPKQIGGWEMLTSRELTSVEKDMLVPIEYLIRTYVKGETRTHLFLLWGPTGPVSEHTPDICFNSQQFNQLGNRRSIQLAASGGEPATIWLSEFERKGVENDCVASWYAWTCTGPLRADSNPQYSFSKDRCLLKVQIEFFVSDRGALEDKQPMRDFVESVQTELANNVFK